MNARMVMTTSLGVCLWFVLAATWCGAEAESQNAQEPGTEAQEPNFYDHYMDLQDMQGRLAQRSLDEQTRLQPQVRKAERRACQQLKKEREQGLRSTDYRRQGGDQFVAFSEQFERYCQTHY
jgi:hypothetical protein